MLEAGNNSELPAIPGKRYFTIGGARNRLQGDGAREDLSQAQQIVRQLRGELEEILRILRR